jgi:gluconokinase
VAGTGKTTLGTALAAQLDVPFIDADDLHPKANIEKMSKGISLTDADREPWLNAIRRTAVQRISRESLKGVVVGCSALKRHYRDILRGSPQAVDEMDLSLTTYFVFIDGPKEVLMDRMLKRQGHFMKANMLESQLNTLERPGDDENTVVVSLEDETPVQVEKATQAIQWQ